MVPSFKYYFFPFLYLLNRHNGICQLSELSNEIANYLKLTEVDLKEVTRGGNLTKHLSRVNYCASYLKKMNLVDSVSSGKYSITQKGKDVLNKYGASLTLSDLRTLPEFIATQISSSSSKDVVYVKPHIRGNKTISGYFCKKKMLKPNNPNIEIIK